MLEKMILKAFMVCACIHLITGCQKPMVPEYLGFINPQLDKAGLQGSLVSVNLKFYNPNNFGLKLKHADMNISLNDKLANHYLLDSTISIPGKDTFFIPVSVKIDLQILLTNAMQTFMSRQVKITLDGKVKLKRGIIPFSRHFHYDVKQSMDSLMNLLNTRP